MGRPTQLEGTPPPVLGHAIVSLVVAGGSYLANPCGCE